MAETHRTTAPYGTWPSPVRAAALAEGALTFADLRVDGQAVLWLQGDPDDGGRYAVMRRTGSDPPQRLTPTGFNARTRVHEYGGGALAAGHGVVLACSYPDQRVWQIGDGEPRPVTPAPQEAAGLRYASMAVLPGGTAFVAVRESHGEDRPVQATDVHGTPEAVNEVVRIGLDDGTVTVLMRGPDFVSSPTPNPTGTHLAWLQWDHPDMPWDSASLWVAELTAEGLRDPRRLAGGNGSAVCELHWADADTLWFCDDPDGWWNVHAVDVTSGQITRLQDEQVESGFPRWVPLQQLVAHHGQPAVLTSDGEGHQVHVVDPTSRRSRPMPVPGLSYFSEVAISGDALVAIAAGPTTPTSVWQLPADGGPPTSLADLPATRFPALSVPQQVTFDTSEDAVAHGLYYPPASSTHTGPDDEAPPLIVMTHGGPTAAARRSLHRLAQYWTSRGFAVIDVDYRGSTGYGRAYRDALRNRWGIADLADVQAAARHLADAGLADPDRLIIEGGSAGGYTTLMAVCTSDVFAAGGNLFGVSDLRALARDTHKFESRYLDSLIGPWPAAEAVYIQRSPLTHIESLSTPLIVLQGDEDEVVPPAQSRQMVAALASRGITHAYIEFPGEQHGFRAAEAIIRSTEARLAFYAHVLGFKPDEDISLPELVTAG